MRRPDTEPPGRPVERGAERLRWLSAAANETADAILRSEPEQLAGKLSAVAERFGKALSIGSNELQLAAAAAREKLAQLAPAMGLQVPSGSAALRLLTPTAKVTPAKDAGDSLSPYELQATMPISAPVAEVADQAQDAPTLVLAPPERVAEMLASGIQDITNTMASDHFRLNEVLRMILETMYRSMGFQRVVFCLRDPKSGLMQGRFGLGAQADTVAKTFSVDLRKTTMPDLFTAVCLKGADTLITDARAAQIAQRLPPWYAKQVNAASFLLLPMSMKNAPFALIYGDKAAPGELALGERELALLRTLRNQAVMAFRQAG
jgi:hypothetical protein